MLKDIKSKNIKFNHKILLLSLSLWGGGTSIYGENQKYYESNQSSSARLLKNVVFLSGEENHLRIEVGVNVFTKGSYLSSMLIYSQPNRIFRLPGRINFELGGVSNLADSPYNFLIAGISEDMLLPLLVSSVGSMFAGVGIGIYIRNTADDRIGSNFTFGERVFLGYSYQGLSIEIFIKHYSNGTLEKPNGGHNFAGLMLGYSF